MTYNIPKREKDVQGQSLFLPPIITLSLGRGISSFPKNGGYKDTEEEYYAAEHSKENNDY